MRHRYILHHGHIGITQRQVWSGPFRTLKAAEQALHGALTTGTVAVIQEEWVGRCDRCLESIIVPPHYYQHGCGEVYTYSPTL